LQRYSNISYRVLSFSVGMLKERKSETEGEREREREKGKIDKNEDITPETIEKGEERGNYGFANKYAEDRKLRVFTARAV